MNGPAPIGNNNLIRNANALVRSVLDTTFKLAGIAAAVVFLGKEAPKGSALNLAGSSIVNGTNSVVEQIVKAERTNLNGPNTSAKAE